MGFFGSLKRLFTCSSKPKKKSSKPPVEEPPAEPKQSSLAARSRMRFESCDNLNMRRKKDKSIIPKLEHEARDSKDFCFVSKAWMDAHKNFLSNFSSPGPISNSPLVEKGQLRPGLRLNVDYIAVPKLVHDYLHKSYGGDYAYTGTSHDIYESNPPDPNKSVLIVKEMQEVPEKKRAFSKRPEPSPEKDSRRLTNRESSYGVDVIEDSQEPVYKKSHKSSFDETSQPPPPPTSGKRNLLDLVRAPEDRAKSYENKLEGGRDSSNKAQPTEVPYKQKSSSDTAEIAAGFHNPSNYCFMNAALQCLLSVPHFAAYFHQKTFRSDRVKKSTPFCEALSNITDKYFAGERIIRPDSLWRITGSRFPGGRQHDLPEFLRYLLEGLETELKKKDKFEATWEAYSNFYNPMLLTTFCGQTIQVVSCKCGHVSQTEQIFTDLTLDLEPTVKKSIELYTRPEKIEGYRCEGCRKQVVINKRVRFGRLPNYLIIQIKRFESWPSPRKSDKRVNFEERMSLDSNAGVEQFRLAAVAVHSGSLGGGHYIAFGLRGESWFSFNDSNCSRVNFTVVKTQQAYLLVYMKV